MRVNVVASTGKSSMHKQHVKFSTYVAWGSGVGGVAAVGVVFEEGAGAMAVDDDDDRSVFEVVVVVVSFLASPSASLLLASFLAVLLGCIDIGEEVDRVHVRAFFVTSPVYFCVGSGHFPSDSEEPKKMCGLLSLYTPYM